MMLLPEPVGHQFGRNELNLLLVGHFEVDYAAPGTLTI